MSARGSSNHRVPAVIALVVFMAAGLFSVTAPAAVKAAPGDVGQAGPSFSGSGADPTGTKPESKVWFNDGFWWASMYNSSASAYTIHRLSGTTWTNTGVVIDDRENTHSDILWDGTKLYVASHVYTTDPGRNGSHERSPLPIQLQRWHLTRTRSTAGSPRRSPTWSSETLVIDKDSTGQLWATWTRGGSVRVNRTTSGDSTWGTEFVPAVTNTSDASDDISTLVAFGGNKIGLLWSRQNGSPDEFRFSIHDDSATDTTWGASVSVFPGNNFADDHLNLKADPGRQPVCRRQDVTFESGDNLVVAEALHRRDVDERHVQHRHGDDDPRCPRGRHDEQPAACLRHGTRVERDHLREDVAAELPVLRGRARHAVRPRQRHQPPEQRHDHEADRQFHDGTPGPGRPRDVEPVLVQRGHARRGGPPPTPTPTPTPGGPSITLNPTADAQVKSTSATTNYGSLASIRTRKDPGTADTYQSYLTFNVAGVTGPVNSVKLRLFTSDESPNVQSVFSGDPTSWTENGLNWNNRPTFTTLRGSGAVPTLGAYNEITLDPALITGNVPISLMITSANSNSAIFNSKEAGPNPPQLVITQTVGNQAPTASPVSKSTAHDVAATVDLAGTDAETCNLVFAPGTVTPAHGTLGCDHATRPAAPAPGRSPTRPRSCTRRRRATAARIRSRTRSATGRTRRCPPRSR